jgi:hypothetical protein
MRELSSVILIYSGNKMNYALNAKNLIVFAASLSLASALPAAGTGTLPVGSQARMNLNTENIYLMDSLVLLNNEIMNNEEEEYILLAPDSGYFTGFNDGMSDVMEQVNSFNYSGVLATDLAALTSNLNAEQESADALGTSYGTGMGTAYQYAVVVLNRRSAAASIVVASPPTNEGTRTSNVGQPASKDAPLMFPLLSVPRSFQRTDR